MKKITFLKNFNNYFNRKIKYYQSYNDYIESVTSNGFVVNNNANFNIGDGVSVKLTVDWSYIDANGIEDEYDWEPDYVLVSETEQNVIKSRWFVMEFVKQSFGKYSVTLRRDVIADNIVPLTTSVAKIEKGIIQNSDSPLIYNGEGVSVNRIKKSETLLADKTGCPWLVAYLSKTAIEEGSELTIASNADLSGVVDLDVFDISDWEYTRSGEKFNFINSIKLTILATGKAIDFEASDTQFILNLKDIKIGGRCVIDKVETDAGFVGETGLYYAKQNIFDLETKRTIHNNLATNISPNVGTFIGRVINGLGGNFIWDGQVPTKVRTKNGKIYQIGAVVETTSNSELTPISQSENISVWNFLNSLWNQSNIPWGDQIQQGTAFAYHVQCNITRVRFSAEELTDLQIKGSLDVAPSKTAAYDIICMPYGQTKRILNDGTHTWIGYTEPERNKEIMDSIVKQLSANVYDYQLLPYCPLDDNQITNEGEITGIASSSIKFYGPGRCTEMAVFAPSDTFNFITEHTMVDGSDIRVEISSGNIELVATQSGNRMISSSPYFDHGNILYTLNQIQFKLRQVTPEDCTIKITYVTEDTILQEVVYVAQRETISRTITKEIDISSLGRENLPIAVNKKLINDCSLFRLCSPNYAGVFEFSPIKNGNVTRISEWKVDCTYKPSTPFIHIAPNFGGLYGRTFSEEFNGTGDQRGLTCGGDFSVAMISDKWLEYQQQNKNYQAVFDRQIENMEVNHNLDMSKAWRDAAFGVVGGTVGGAVSGYKASGSPYGAIAGGVVGLGSSGIGAGMGIWEKEQKYTESVKYTTDIHSLQLGNIQALPNSLVRTDAFAATNRYIPFIEIYDCTEEEKDAYINMLTYGGMSVGIIDTLGNWLHNNGDYIKAQLIRTDIVGDNHLIGAVAYELNSGLYVEEIL